METATLSVRASTSDHAGLRAEPAVRAQRAKWGRTSAAHATRWARFFLAHGGTPPTGSLLLIPTHVRDPAVLESMVAGQGQGLGEAAGEAR